MQPRVNRDQLNQWSVPNDEASERFLDRLVRNFLENVPNVTHEMEGHLRSRDFDAIAKLAHILKGTSGNLGLMLLQEYCTLLEQSAKGGDEKETGEWIRKIQEETPQTMEALNRMK